MIVRRLALIKNIPKGKKLMFSSFKRVALFFILALAAMANTSKIVSNADGTDPSQWNDGGTSGTIVANVNPAPALNWSPASDVDSAAEWVSFAITGNQNNPSFQDTANGTVVTFTQIWYIPGTPSAATISAMSADTTSIIINGNTVVSQGSYTGVNYAGCGDYNGCLFSTIATYSGTTYLHAGYNVIQFQVKKLMQTALNGNKTGFGLVYSGSATYSTCM